MNLAVYNPVPMVLNDGEHEYKFTLKVNPATDSFRLVSTDIRRSIFIGRRMFNKLFQLIRNEYGHTLGRIQYDDSQMLKGSASTDMHDQFRFEIHEGNDVEVVIEDEQNPGNKVKATLINHFQNKREKEIQLTTLIPSVLAALIFSKELRLIA